MAFKTHRQAGEPPATPELLYSELAHRADAPGLWPWQSAVLGVYNDRHVKARDVAIELPTGAGKTLVGGLIGEWRRQKLEERVAYLAPTRQLARQAAEEVASHGIPVALLIGAHGSWDPDDESHFNRGQAIGFATYNAVFNSNPYIDAQTLLLDDAHSAESLVASNWSVLITRDDQAYDPVLEVLGGCGALSATMVSRLREADTAVVEPVHLAGIAEVAAGAADLEQALADAAARGFISTQAQFAAQVLGGSLGCCHVYASTQQILIRPFITPTLAHRCFNAAAQRLYLSATLGDGGELERAFGRRTIARIPAPADAATRGTGRRFFIFPALATDLHEEAAEKAFVSDIISTFGKAIILTPDNRTRTQVTEAVVPAVLPQWSAQNLEDAPEEFETAPTGVLALANRYDGIDLPGDSCRLVILAGLPTGAHLQEQFLRESLGAVNVLTERMKTRLTQGAGRATRDSGDYAAVLVLGRRLITFCEKSEVLAALHPELRAEVTFGLDNSTSVSSAEIRDNIGHFLDQDTEWRTADAAIRTDADAVPRTSLPGAQKLAASAPFEVAAVGAAWQSDWPRAIDQAKQAVEELAGGEDIRHYQALWHYTIASWMVIASRTSGQADWLTAADAHFADARAAARGTRWLAELTTDAHRLAAADGTQETATDALDDFVVDQIAAAELRVAAPNNFAAVTNRIEQGLGQTESGPFERALDELATLAGAGAVLDRSGADAEPDSVWLFGDAAWLAIEAKSNVDPAGQVPADEARQACGHLNYAASERGQDAPDGSVTFYVTPQTVVHPAAAKVVDAGLYLVSVEQMSALAARLIVAWRQIRTRTRDLEVTDAMPVVASVLQAHRALPSQWMAELTGRRVIDG